MKKAVLLLCLALGLLCAIPVTGIGAENQTPSPAVPSAEELALRAAAEGGDAQAQYDLGLALVRPIPPHFGPVKEGAEAAVWLEKSASQGNADAAFLLGYICQYGTGVAKDVGKSVTWMTKAADAGHIPAMVTLATVYKTGDGVMKDKIKSRNLYAKAAELGNNNARTALATMYMEGDGVHKDGKLALAWFRRAVKDNHAPAMLGLGSLYAKEDLGLLNGPKAVYWMHRAVASGYVPAVYALGILYRDGVGTVQPDPYQAYLWLGLTFELSGPHEEMPYWFANAARVLPPDQKKKADDELDGWLKKGPPAPPATEPE